MLVLLTAMILGLWIFWHVKSRKFWFYNEVETVAEATHVFIVGKPGNLEIIKLRNDTKILRNLLNDSLNPNIGHLKNGDYRVSLVK